MPSCRSAAPRSSRGCSGEPHRVRLRFRRPCTVAVDEQAEAFAGFFDIGHARRAGAVGVARCAREPAVSRAVEVDLLGACALPRRIGDAVVVARINGRFDMNARYSPSGEALAVSFCRLLLSSKKPQSGLSTAESRAMKVVPQDLPVRRST